MKAVVYTRYGGPEVLQIREVERPVPKDKEVLVKVISVSLNDWDWGLLQGAALIDRLMSGLAVPRKKILGSDIAGIVESVGKDVKQFQPGDAVFGDLSGDWGGLAEYVCAKEKSLATKPSGMSFDEAAAIPQAAMLAVQGLIDRGHIQQGQKVLINGAGGGVGTFGIQIAKLYGTEVTGVDSTAKLELLRSMGFDHVIDYTKEDFTKNGHLYDLILDVKTNRPPSHYIRALSGNGIYATVGGSFPRLIQILLLSPLISLFTKKRLRIVMLKPNKDLAYMKAQFEAGRVKPVIDGPYPFEEVAMVFKIFGEGTHKGKLVIRVGNP